MRFLDPATTAQLKNLSLSVRRLAIDGASSGAHLASRQGLSQEFSQHRPYAPGDPLKFLDWKLYARNDRFFTKEFEEERSLRLQLMVDASRSMLFGKKWEIACRASMALAYLALAQGDSAALSCFAKDLGTTVPSGRGMTWLERLDSALSEHEPEGPTAIVDAIRSLALRLRKRSYLVLFSDCYADPESLISVLKLLRSRKHAVWVVQILSPEERDLPFQGTVSFEDIETNASLRCDPLLLQEAYRRALSRWTRTLETSFQRGEIAFDSVYTDSPWPSILKQLLESPALARR